MNTLVRGQALCNSEQHRARIAASAASMCPSGVNAPFPAQCITSCIGTSLRHLLPWRASVPDALNAAALLRPGSKSDCDPCSGEAPAGHHLRAHRSNIFPCAPHGAESFRKSGEKIFSAAGLNWATNLLPNPAPAIRSLLFSLISRLLKAESSFSRCGRLSRPHREFERWQKYANCWRRYRAGSGVGSPSSSPSPPPACRRLALKPILDITPARCGQRHAPRCWRTLRRT